MVKEMKQYFDKGEKVRIINTNQESLCKYMSLNLIWPCSQNYKKVGVCGTVVEDIDFDTYYVLNIGYNELDIYVLCHNSELELKDKPKVYKNHGGAMSQWLKK